MLTLTPAVMSSQSSQEAVLKAFEAGARDYLVKPIRKNEVTTLWQHLWRFSQTSGGSSPSAAAGGVVAAGTVQAQPGRLQWPGMFLLKPAMHSVLHQHCTPLCKA